MKHTAVFSSLAFYGLLVIGIPMTLSANDSPVSIVDRGNYFEVIQDYSQGVSYYIM